MRLKDILLVLCCFVLTVSARAGGFILVPGTALRDAIPMEVSGRNGILIKQRLQFGGYQTAFVKRGLISTWTGATGWTNAIWMQNTSGKQSIRFALTDGTDTAEAIGTTRIQRNELIIDHPNSLPTILADVLAIGSDLHEDNLSVALRLPNQSESWELYLDNEATQIRRSTAAGYLRQGETVYAIHPVWRVRSRKGKEADMPFGSVGLEFRNAAGDAVAAVNLMNAGAIHIDEKLPASERLLLSTACTALLLQSEI